MHPNLYNKTEYHISNYSNTFSYTTHACTLSRRDAHKLSTFKCTHMRAHTCRLTSSASAQKNVHTLTCTCKYTMQNTHIHTHTLQSDELGDKKLSHQCYFSISSAVNTDLNMTAIENHKNSVKFCRDEDMSTWTISASEQHMQKQWWLYDELFNVHTLLCTFWCLNISTLLIAR